MTRPDPSKADLRREMRRLLADGRHDPEPVRRSLLRWLAEHPQCVTIATYAALPGEVDLMPAVRVRPERRWVFPRVVGESLVFHQVTEPEDDLAPGAFGVAEPLPSQPLVPIGEIDAFLCPGLAFDARGSRLGRGRGFYDRLLACARPGAIKLGIAFAHQVRDTIPCEPHDVRMDVVIRPS